MKVSTACSSSRVASVSPGASAGLRVSSLVGVAGDDGEPGAVAVDEHVAGDPRVIDADRAADAGVRGERAVERDRGVRVDPGGDRGHVLERVAAQDQRASAGLASQQRGPAVGVGGDDLGGGRDDGKEGAGVLVAGGREGERGAPAQAAEVPGERELTTASSIGSMRPTSSWCLTPNSSFIAPYEGRDARDVARAVGDVHRRAVARELFKGGGGGGEELLDGRGEVEPGARLDPVVSRVSRGGRSASLVATYAWWSALATAAWVSGEVNGYWVSR